jgi:uncharacterized repeat protein (TIGR01451 family)
MKTTKRLICLLLAVVTCASLALTGCKAPEKPAIPTTTPTANPTTAPTTQPTTTPTTAPTTPSTGATTAPTTQPTTAPTTKPTEPVASFASAEQMKNVVAEKVSSAGGTITAHPGGRITYKLHITNNNKEAIKVKVTDTLPAGTVLVDGCESANGTSLSWEISYIGAGATHTITYNVKPDYTIKQVRESENDIILKNTPAKVMDKEVSAPAKDIYVLETFNATDIRRIEMAIDALVTANLTAKNCGQLMNKTKALLRANTVTTSNDNRCTLNVNLTLLNVTLYDAHCKVAILNHWLPVNLTNLTSSRCSQLLLTHNALTHSSHLWTALWVNDSSDDVTTKGWTNLV